MTSLRMPVDATAVGRPTYSHSLPNEPATAEIGRRLILDVLGIWQLDDLADPAALIVTELIANASRHTPCPDVRLIVRRPSTRRVRMGVVDREPSRLPVLGQAEYDDEAGRGLLLIDAVADRWGCDLYGLGRRPWAKEVWAELRTEAGA
ncbi:ATP-binding protein [Streptomyces hebeiensis]